MKKITGMILALGLVAGTAALTFAADDKAPAPKMAVKCKDSKTGKAVKAVKGKCPEGSMMVPAKAAAKTTPPATK